MATVFLEIHSRISECVQGLSKLQVFLQQLYIMLRWMLGQIRVLQNDVRFLSKNLYKACARIVHGNPKWLIFDKST